MMPLLSSPRAGDLFSDRFELQYRAGGGGMGDVFCAHDRRSGDRIGLKVVNHPREEQVERFLQETCVSEARRHPGILRHYAHAFTDEVHGYLAMEWLSGEDLCARLKRGALSVNEAVALTLRLADVIADVHARGFIHRDLKPENIFLVDGDLE